MISILFLYFPLAFGYHFEMVVCFVVYIFFCVVDFMEWTLYRFWFYMCVRFFYWTYLPYILFYYFMYSFVVCLFFYCCSSAIFFAVVSVDIYSVYGSLFFSEFFYVFFICFPHIILEFFEVFSEALYSSIGISFSPTMTFNSPLDI